MKHKLMLQKICHANELSNISPDLFKDDKALLSALIDNNICMVLDYKYENPKDVAEFIKHRLHQLALKEIELSFEHLENDFEQSDDDSFIEFMLFDFNKQIKKSANILLLESHSDSYLLFITSKKHSRNLTKIKSDFWQFYELDNKPNAKIYTIYCPNCHNMNVWELAFDEATPDNEVCDSCHTPLWDNNGNPYQGVDVEIDDVYLTDYD